VADDGLKTTKGIARPRIYWLRLVSAFVRRDAVWCDCGSRPASIESEQGSRRLSGIDVRDVPPLVSDATRKGAGRFKGMTGPGVEP
jgi:hypothetical protein